MSQYFQSQFKFANTQRYVFVVVFPTVNYNLLQFIKLNQRRLLTKHKLKQNLKSVNPRQFFFFFSGTQWKNYVLDNWINSYSSSAQFLVNRDCDRGQTNKLGWRRLILYSPIFHCDLCPIDSIFYFISSVRDHFKLLLASVVPYNEVVSILDYWNKTGNFAFI